MNKEKKIALSVSLSEKLLKLEEEMKMVREELKMAKLDGDLSENADWSILNEKLENLHKQIFFLKEKLTLIQNKTLLEVSITYLLLETGEEKTVKLTEEWMADPTQGRISVTSPLGQVLMNKKDGEVSEVCTKENSYKIQIVNIK
jgi:transcription elongation factor GreA